MNNIYNNVVNDVNNRVWKKSVFVGPIPHGFTLGLVLLKDLPKTPNTVRYFHAQIKMEKWTTTKITGFGITDFRGSNSYGITWWLKPH
jgi:hypothetical protein